MPGCKTVIFTFDPKTSHGVAQVLIKKTTTVKVRGLSLVLGDEKIRFKKSIVSFLSIKERDRVTAKLRRLVKKLKAKSRENLKDLIYSETLI